METASGPANGGAPSAAFGAGKRDLFTRAAGWTIRATGGRWGFLVALGSVIIWALMGPLFHYSETWQLVINTGTTIVTFLMVFLIQNAQNRESKAIHLKLDELILNMRTARNEMIDIEHLSEEELAILEERYRKVARRHQHKLAQRLEMAEKVAEETAGALESCRTEAAGETATAPEARSAQPNHTVLNGKAK